MDITKAFEDFLERKVNLNEGRVERIKEAERILGGFIESNKVFGHLYIGTKPQGSYRQETIIKPCGEDGQFDVDLLVGMETADPWEAKDYINKLAAEFRASGRYKDLTDTKGKHRCVTIDYEGDFHVDLIPMLQQGSEQVICNKDTNEYEVTDGDGYARWFETQGAIAGSHLVHVVRLLKYLRDFEQDFDTKSIILTTIAGMQVRSGGSYASLPQAFATIVTDMDAYLSQFAVPPSVPNPAMPEEETFDRHWIDEYESFDLLKSAITRYASTARAAVAEMDEGKAIALWREIFGERFGASDGGMTAAGMTAPPVFPPMPGPMTPPLPPRNREVG